jgi:PKD repeat protein
VNFFDSSIVDITHTWDFGDGKRDTAKNPTHTYAGSGIYTVNLYTTNKSCSDTATSTVPIINEKGVISLAGNIFCRGNNLVVDISGINITNINNTKWDFGDGTVITVNGTTKANHTYLTTGKFLIKATMTDLNNCQYFYQSKDSITIIGPLSSFISANPAACRGGSVSFTDKSETDGIHDIVKWEWDYGDKVNHVYNRTTSFQHTYADTGYYTIRLTVTDTYGCSDSLRRINYVYVSQPYASLSFPIQLRVLDGKLLSKIHQQVGSSILFGSSVMAHNQIRQILRILTIQTVFIHLNYLSRMLMGAETVR